MTMARPAFLIISARAVLLPVKQVELPSISAHILWMLTEEKLHFSIHPDMRHSLLCVHAAHRPLILPYLSLQLMIL